MPPCPFVFSTESDQDRCDKNMWRMVGSPPLAQCCLPAGVPHGNLQQSAVPAVDTGPLAFLGAADTWHKQVSRAMGLSGPLRKAGLLLLKAGVAAALEDLGFRVSGLLLLKAGVAAALEEVADARVPVPAMRQERPPRLAVHSRAQDLRPQNSG